MLFATVRGSRRKMCLHHLHNCVLFVHQTRINTYRTRWAHTGHSLLATWRKQTRRKASSFRMPRCQDCSLQINKQTRLHTAPACRTTHAPNWSRHTHAVLEGGRRMSGCTCLEWELPESKDCLFSCCFLRSALIGFCGFSGCRCDDRLRHLSVRHSVGPSSHQLVGNIIP